jgi:hypothetical protein
MASGSNKRQRRKIRHVRCTDDEFNAIGANADGAGLSAAAFMRAAALGNAGPRARRRLPAEHVTLRQMLGQLGKIGSNLNQIARAFNMAGQVSPPELTQALTDVPEMRALILDVLGKKSGHAP